MTCPTLLAIWQPLEEGETRTPLNAQQVAQYLTQGGMFEHEGEIFIDPLHREHNKNFLGKMIGGGLSVGIRQLAKHHTFTAQADRAPFYELSNNYRFAWTDAVSRGVRTGWYRAAGLTCSVSSYRYPSGPSKLWGYPLHHTIARDLRKNRGRPQL